MILSVRPSEGKGEGGTKQMHSPYNLLRNVMLRHACEGILMRCGNVAAVSHPLQLPVDNSVAPNLTWDIPSRVPVP
jgi:hypothetical protein